MKEILTGLLQTLGLAWWVEILTEKPNCTYYFGPFPNAEAAREAQFGYVEDLQQEGAQGIKVNIKRCRPEKLTISEDLDNFDGKIFPQATRIFSGQM
ncbi:MAG: DUF1816 domain-containing protein [Leptolyngbyaceae cyanobacterium bins.59]|nr:DUF1816 domain-containing protein [Leptolyngbyaceae cyanobacterium bins.59]